MKFFSIKGVMLFLATLLQVASSEAQTYRSIFDPPVQPSWPRNDSAIPVACVGDSITAGYLSTGGQTYPNQLQALR